MAKRAITIAAAGHHNLLMLGPPGSGKTMLAKRIPTILPGLTPGESIETTRIYSAMGLLPAGQPLLATRPTARRTTPLAMPAWSGAAARARRDFAFAQWSFVSGRVPEFNRRTLEVLRQPLEDGTVTISRALTSTTFPASFILIAALNPALAATGMIRAAIATARFRRLSGT